MDRRAALDFLARHRHAVFITNRRNGHPQSSNVSYWLDGEVIRVSMTIDRAKTRNLQRDPKAALHVSSEDFGSYVVVEAQAVLTPPALSPDDDTAELLRTYYRALAGEHPDWDDYDRAMIEEGRLIATLPVGYVYGILRA